MIANSGMALIRFVLFWLKTVCASVQNESCPLCRSLTCTVFAPTQKRSTRTKCERSKICSIENLPRIALIKYGWAIPLTSKSKNAWVYLCAIIDLFSRKVVGYRVSLAASTRLVTTTFRNAYEERGNPKNLTFHSDRGGQYISAAFSKLLQQYNVKQSFSASGTPLDNAVAETFFATFKKEETYRREYTSERHFRKSVDEYIRFYNEVRPHQTLKYKTPQAFEATYQSSYIEKPCSYNDAGVWKHLRNFDVSRYTLAIHKKTESLVSQGFPNKKPPVFR